MDINHFLRKSLLAISELLTEIERIGLNSKEPAIKFLGVYLDPKLNFKFHVQKIVNKIPRSLYMIQMSKNFLSCNALLSLYYALAHSHLIYAIHVWSAAPPSTLSLITKIQKKAVRIINKVSNSSHTEHLFKKCNILPFEDLSQYFKLLFMYDFKEDLLPLSFKNLWKTNAKLRRANNEDEPQERNLRNDSDFAVPFIQIEHYFKFPLADFPRTWNNFEFNFVYQSRNMFKSLLKEYFLSKLASIVNCNRLLCPACHLQAAVDL
jgi:hypothetical protein